MLTCQKALFSLPDQVTYLNCAYMSPLLKAVEQVGYAMVSWKARPYNIGANDFFQITQELKTAFSVLINNGEPDRIAIIPSVSYGMANVANNLNLKKGEKIIVLAEQFPSNYYPWERVAHAADAQIVTISASTNEDRARSINKGLLGAIDDQTALVSISTTHWVDGTRLDLEAIRERTWSVGALLVIDGTQSIGALPFDIEKIYPDALVCAGYKWLLGPYSIGCAYYGPYFDEGVPIEENWANRKGSENFSGLVNYESDFQPKAWRYSVGQQSNFVLVPMLTRALQQINDWGVPNIQAYCKEISSDFIEAVKQLGCEVETENDRCGHLFGVRLPPQFNIEDVKSKLAMEKVYVSVRGKALRISPHVYNTKEDFDRLLACFY